MGQRIVPMNTYCMKNPFRRDIKCTSSSISCVDPVNNSLPMRILIVIHFTICITEGIPILPNSKGRFSCIYVIFDITTPKSSDKIKPPSIIPNFFPVDHMLKQNYTTKFLTQQYLQKHMHQRENARYKKWSSNYFFFFDR